MKKAVDGLPDRRNSLSKSLETCGSMQYAGDQGEARATGAQRQVCPYHRDFRVLLRI